MKKSKILPKKLQAVLWSYDIKKIDLERNKKEIITQVLNYGDWQDLKWLFRTYSEKEIKEVIKNPRRGVWFEKVLNFWATVFDLHIKKDVWQKAIFDIHPH